MRYANPFRFYLTVSVMFFLIVGATESYDKFNEFRKGKVKEETISSDFMKAKNALDSSSTKFKTNLNEALKDLDSTERAQIIKKIPTIASDSLDKKNLKNTKGVSRRNNGIQISGLGNWDKFSDFYDKNKDMEIDDALDSLNVEKTFWNRFSYSRVKLIHDIAKDNNKKQEMIKQIISYLSISLFILLPIFTLFLKFFYLRRKFTYVEHLVFVFHTQTVFFLLLTIFYLLNHYSAQSYAIPIFLLLFLIYLFLAMKKFYNQGYFKTFFKFIFINMSFTLTSSIGFALVAILAFML